MADFQPIDTAPQDGTVIGGWSAREPGVIKIIRWGRHLGNVKHDPCWITLKRGLAISNVPTHWIELGQLPSAAALPGTHEPQSEGGK